MGRLLPYLPRCRCRGLTSALDVGTPAAQPQDNDSEHKRRNSNPSATRRNLYLRGLYANRKLIPKERKRRLMPSAQSWSAQGVLVGQPLASMLEAAKVVMRLALRVIIVGFQCRAAAPRLSFAFPSYDGDVPTCQPEEIRENEKVDQRSGSERNSKSRSRWPIVRRNSYIRRMTIKLLYHPLSRAANTVWALEEVGCPYELQYIDFARGEHKEAPVRTLNPMGKVPTLIDGDTVVTEAGAIALYLADRFAPGRLAPALDAPERAAYLRWSFYAPSVIEPGCMAHANGWEYRPSSAGFGTYDEILDTISAAIGDGPWLLGEQFTMADLVFGGTVRYMAMFDMIDKRPEYAAYVGRLSARPAAKKAEAINARIAEERGLNRK